jgi:hypothetical protein
LAAGALLAGARALTGIAKAGGLGAKIEGLTARVTGLSTKAGTFVTTLQRRAAALVRGHGLPPLTGTIAESFEGGVYWTHQFKAGTKLYRAEGAEQGIGSFFGRAMPASAAEAEDLYNIAKWGNPADVVGTYVLKADATLYVGRVKGGQGIQVLVPRNRSS